METPIDYQAVLADLKKRREDLDKAIAAVEPIAAAQALGTSGSTQTYSESNIPNDAFFNMTVVEAVIKYLRIVKRKKSIREIVKALEDGGFTHQSKNFYNVVSSIVSREKAHFVNISGEIGLPEWYGRGALKQKQNKPTPSLEREKDHDEEIRKANDAASSNGQVLRS